jgi:hypothetical protein
MHLNSILYRGSVNKTRTHSRSVCIVDQSQGFVLNFPTFALPTYFSIKLHDTKVEHLKKYSQDILRKCCKQYNLRSYFKRFKKQFSLLN